MLQLPLHFVKCKARVTISKHGLIEPFGFKNADVEVVIVAKEHYIDELKKFWKLLRSHRGVNRDVQWSWKDGATPNTTNILMEWLNHRFPNRLISRRRNTECSPLSSDQKPPDFYLCIERQHVWEQSNSKWSSIRKLEPYRKRVSQGDWQLRSTNSSVSSAQWPSFGTRPVKKAFFELETSN